ARSPRAGGRRADGERHQEIADGGGRPAGGTSGRPRRIEWIAGFPWIAVRDLAGHGLPHQHPPRLARERDARRVAPGPVALVNGRPHLGRHVAGVDDVLDAERHAGERAARAGLVLSTRALDNLRRIEKLPREPLRLALLDALQARAYDRFARRGPG